MKFLTLAKAGHFMMVRFKWLLLSFLFLTSCQKEFTTAPVASPSIAATTSNSPGLSTNLNTGISLKRNYVSSAPLVIYEKYNLTINGDSINGGSSTCISIINCANIHITHCKLQNSSAFGIFITNSTNVLVDSTDILNVGTGIAASGCAGGGIRVQYNQIENMMGPFPKGSSIQFNKVGGPYNRIMYNNIQNITGESNPEDAISLYQSNGVVGDMILVLGNKIRGGGPSSTGSGINLGDGGGSYECALNNTLVNTGYIGIQITGGTNIQAQNNTIYSDPFPWSHLGLGYGNFSGLPSNNITISGNKIKWLAGKASDLVNYPGKTYIEQDESYQAGATQPTGWSTNVVNASINSTILPTTLVNFNLY